LLPYGTYFHCILRQIKPFSLTMNTQMPLSYLPHDTDIHKSSTSEDCKIAETCCDGRTFSLLEKGLQSSFTIIAHVVENVFLTLKVICADPNSFAAVIRKFDPYILALVEKINKSPGEFQKLKSVIGSTVSCINVLQIAADIDYGVQAKYKQEGKFAVLGRLAMFVAHVGETILWFSQIGFINLKKIATSLGNISIFTKAIPISLRWVTARTCGIAYALFALDALQRTMKPGDIFQKTMAKLELSANAAEVLLDLMLVAGVVNVISLGIMAGICVSLEIGVLLYQDKYKAGSPVK